MAHASEVVPKHAERCSSNMSKHHTLFSHCICTNVDKRCNMRISPLPVVGWFTCEVSECFLLQRACCREPCLVQTAANLQCQPTVFSMQLGVVRLVIGGQTFAPAASVRHAVNAVLTKAPLAIPHMVSRHSVKVLGFLC